MENKYKAKIPGYQSFVDAEHQFLKNDPKIEGTELLLWQVEDFLKNNVHYRYAPHEIDPYERKRPLTSKIKEKTQLLESTLITAKWGGLILTGSMILIRDWKMAIAFGLGTALVFSFSKSISSKK
jgi:hypothetical protein